LTRRFLLHRHDCSAPNCGCSGLALRART
jgi:hypothetical protein